MTVILNEAALKVLLDTQDGPVGRFVQRKAALVVDQAQRNVRTYFGSAAALTVDQDIQFDMEGSTATVGIKDAGSKARRLARYQNQGTVNWLIRALEVARGR